MEEKTELEMESFKSGRKIMDLLAERKQYIVGPDETDLDHLEKIHEKDQVEGGSVACVVFCIIGIILAIIGAVLLVTGNGAGGLVMLIIGPFFFILFLILSIVSSTKANNAATKVADLNRQLDSEIAIKQQIDKKIAALENDKK